MAGFLFNEGAYQLLSNGTNWGSDTIKARLVTTAAGVPDIDADVMTGIGSTEATATCTLGTKVGPTKSDANDHVTYSSANAVFTAAAGAIGACTRMVIFKFVTNDAASIPLACVDITSVTPNGGDVTVTCPTVETVATWFYTQQHA